jgi:triphosphoribosyl-dephospho-CoA synthetase
MITQQLLSRYMHKHSRAARLHNSATMQSEKDICKSNIALQPRHQVSEHWHTITHAWLPEFVGNHSADELEWFCTGAKHDCKSSTSL